MGGGSGHCGHAAGGADEDCRDRRYTGGFQRLLRRGIGIRSRVCGVARDFDFGVGSAEKREFDGPAADLAAARARRDQDGRPAVRRAERMAGLILLLVTTAPGTAKDAQVSPEKDHTLQAKSDEKARAKTPLQM